MILIIDDLDNYVVKLGEFLKNFSENYIHADNMQDLFRMSADQMASVTIILLDENMPEAQGKEVFEDFLLPEIRKGSFVSLKLVLGNSTIPRKQEYLLSYSAEFPSVQFENVGKSKIEEYLKEWFVKSV